MASEFATLSVNGQDIKLPIIVGTEGEKAIDITALRKTTGCLAFDPGLMNTAVCRSSMTAMCRCLPSMRISTSPRRG